MIARPSRVASRFLRASVIIPLSQAEEAFNSMLADWGVLGRVRAFNSGNIGLKIDAGEAGVLYYIDQPGVVSAENQRGGFISFGSNPKHPDVLVEHFGNTFGDVQMTRTERMNAWEEVMMFFEKELLDAGYSPDMPV